MTARVRGVMATSICRASMLAVSSSTSTHTAQLAVVEHRVARPRRLRAVLSGADGAYLDAPPGQAQDLERDFVPAGRARRADVEGAFGAFADQKCRSERDIVRPGGRADLVIDHPQGRAALGLPQDRAHEIAAAPVNPRGAHDQMPASRGADARFAL